MNQFSPWKILLLAFAPVAALFILGLAGCTMIPKYEQPASNISTNWPSVPGYAKTETTPAAVPAADIGWHDFFRDQRLQQVIRIALTNNPNLLASVYNVQESKSLYRVQQANLVPTVDLGASGQRTRTPNVYTGGTNTAPPLQYTEYNLNVAMTQYELDLFGRVRSLTRQALETYMATDEARRSAQIALVAQVGSAYISEQEAAEQLTIAREMLNAAQQTYDLTKRSFEAGESSQFDLNSASIQLQNSTAAVAGYAQQLAEASDNLTLLAGGPLPPELQPSSPFNPDICAEVPAGLPSDLLQRRPDVAQAEHQLKAANANIGAARAAFFPTVTLTGQAGLASTTLQSLFAPGARAWNLSPQIVWPIFDMGTAYHNLKADEAAKMIQAANYKSTVQTAFKEVADALAVRETVESQLTQNQELVKTDQQSYDLTKAGFQTGVNSALDMNVTLQTLDSARLNLIQAQYSRLISLVNLYQALGGGWSEQTVEQTAKQ
ncbi:MAG TPA: TolC family protein [Pseudomonadales bacterium]|nr:TolC family protein [Pseudomonadales bacterium]